MNALLDDLIRLFDGPDVAALVLMGSHARGDAAPFSDVDLVRFVRSAEAEKAQTLFIGDQLVVVSTVTPARIDPWFCEPGEAVDTIRGLEQARVLLDRAGYFAAIQARAHAFVWDEQMQRKADQWAGAELVGLIEEVHKGLNGLVEGGRGRLLNARFGLSWLLSRVVAVQRGILMRGDNGIYDDLVNALGAESRWVLLRRTAWGIEDDAGVTPILVQQVVAGLQLYVETVQLMASALQPEDALKVNATVNRIRQVLATYQHTGQS